MSKSFSEMKKRALEIKAKYNEIEPKKWGLKEDLAGMITDVGDLSKILMAYNGYRNIGSDIKKALSHELSDILWCLMVIAEKTDVDLEQSFFEVMENIDKKIDKKKDKNVQ